MNVLVVKRFNGSYFVYHTVNNTYYRVCYRERWSADSTIIGLTGLWEEEPKFKVQDEKTLFVAWTRECRFCRAEAAYIAEYGEDPTEVMDDVERKAGKAIRAEVRNEENKLSTNAYFTQLELERFQSRQHQHLTVVKTLDIT